jgi:putative hydrolase of the HAD superfamily
MADTGIPFVALDALFLDAGNTLFSMDFALMSKQLALLGHACPPLALARAEAAARPAVSDHIRLGNSTESQDVFRFYLRELLERVLKTGEPERVELADRWAAVLEQPALRERLWTSVLPGVRKTLPALREAGLKLVIVSNSDGTMESALERAGLRHLLDAVVDSARVGFEKPDPRIFLHALEVARARPEHTLHVGDLYAADVAGARAAGIHAVLLDPFGDWTHVDCPTRPDLESLGREILEARRAVS